jgi:hypothetical protein
VIDVMISILALVCGLLVAGTWLEAARERPNWIRIDRYHAGVFGGSWVLLFLTIAPVPMRLLTPGARIRRIVREPGFQTGVAACLTLALRAVDHGYILRLPWRNSTEALDFLLSVQPVFYMGPSIAVVWIVLALGGRWHPQPAWSDRLGRLLGWIWLTGYFIGLLTL